MNKKLILWQQIMLKLINIRIIDNRIISLLIFNHGRLLVFLVQGISPINRSSPEGMDTNILVSDVVLLLTIIQEQV